MDGRGGIRQTANVFEALRESADHSGVAMGAKTRSLLTRTHFVRISSAKMHMNQFAHGHERLKQRGALWHGYPKPHAAMRATQVRSSVLGGHLVLFFFSSPLPSRPVHARAANANEGARCTRLRRRHVSARVHEKEAADARALPMKGPDHVACYTHVCPAADCDREGHSLGAVNAGARSSKRLRATCRPGLPRPGRRVGVFACAGHYNTHTSMIHPQPSRTSARACTQRTQRIEFAHGARRISKPAMGRATRLLQHVH